MGADAGGVFHPFWIDYRTGVQQVWNASVAVDGAAASNGSATLAALHDRSHSVQLVLSDPVFDTARNETSVTAQLKNTSKRTLRGPFTARVTQLSSTLGYATVEDADNGG